MPSPFPGMNPFVERETVWHDFHERWIPLAAELIGAQVMPRYLVKFDEHVFIHQIDEPRQLAGRGDVLVVDGPDAFREQSAAATLEAPSVVTQLTVDVERLSFLELYDRDSRELITVVELLSPTNKRGGPDRDHYLAKRYQILASTANFVEVDLLRGLTRMPWNDLAECDYCVVVSRPSERPQAQAWTLTLPERLPQIPIPLRVGEADAELALQDCLHRIYDIAGYEYYIYDGPPEPLLSQEMRQWAAPFIPSAGRSTS